MDKEISSLEKENILLKQKLESAQKWMKSQVEEDISSLHNKWAISQEIEEKIYSFFSPEALSYFPTNAVENIISAEIIYKHLLSWEDLDGIGVIIWYQKVIDGMIELYITKWFRKYIIKNNIHIPYINDPLEKSLRAIVEKKHIFSLGRVYQSLKEIDKETYKNPYISELARYLKSRPFIQKSLLQSSFLLQLEWLINLQAITEKRHSGRLSKVDTLKARNYINGNFEDKNCLLYILCESQNTPV